MFSSLINDSYDDKLGQVLKVWWNYNFTIVFLMTHNSNELINNGEIIMTHNWNEFINNGEIIISPVFLFVLFTISHKMYQQTNRQIFENKYEQKKKYLKNWQIFTEMK